jgi:hypothetical protein
MTVAAGRPTLLWCTHPAPHDLVCRTDAGPTALWRRRGIGRAARQCNALKHGMYTRRKIERRRQQRMLFGEAEERLIALCDS